MLRTDLKPSDRFKTVRGVIERTLQYARGTVKIEPYYSTVFSDVHVYITDPYHVHACIWQQRTLPKVSLPE